MRPLWERASQRRRSHLIDEDHGEVVCISADPLPSHNVRARCRPSTGVAGSEDLVGAGGGDQGKDGEERTHGKTKVSRRGVKKVRVNEVDEKGESIREKNVDSPRDNDGLGTRV